jgi:hypothetical protein
MVLPTTVPKIWVEEYLCQRNSLSTRLDGGARCHETRCRSMAEETTLAKTSGAPLPSERSMTPAAAGGRRSAAEKYSDAVSQELLWAKVGAASTHRWRPPRPANKPPSAARASTAHCCRGGA